jgi:hypothetical protein
MIIDEIFFRAMGRQDDGTRTLASAIVMAADSQGPFVQSW